MEKALQIALGELLKTLGGSLPSSVNRISDEQLFRVLRTIAPPNLELSEDYFIAQDAFLRAQSKAKGIHAVDVSGGSQQLVLWRGDITTLAVDAIVNAANSQLLGCFQPGHSCIDNAIHSAAGLQLRNACAALLQTTGSSVEPTGKARITPAYNLPSRYVIHTVGPIVSGQLTDQHRQQLASCYRSCLQLADEQGLASIALCCISTGVFGFPKDEAAQIAVATVKEFLRTSSMRVVFNVFLAEDQYRYEQLLSQ